MHQIFIDDARFNGLEVEEKQLKDVTKNIDIQEGLPVFMNPEYVEDLKALLSSPELNNSYDLNKYSSDKHFKHLKVFFKALNSSQSNLDESKKDIKSSEAGLNGVIPTLNQFSGEIGSLPNIHQPHGGNEVSSGNLFLT